MPEDPRPQVHLKSIEKLSWKTKKKIVDEEPTVVTSITFEAEPSSDQMRTLYTLLKSGGALNVTFTSPQLMMQFEVNRIDAPVNEEE